MTDTPSKTAQRKSRSMLLLMAFLFGLPYVLAWGFMNFKEDLPLPAASNKGQLISPVRAMSGIALQDLQGQPFSTNDLQGKWVLLTVDSSSCTQACQKNLYNIRQIRKAVGSDQRRVSRLLLLTDNTAVSELKNTLQDYQGMRIASGPDNAVQRITGLLKNPNERVEGGVYLIDPLGNFMMSYAPDTDAELILKDLRRLLKVSKLG